MKKFLFSLVIIFVLCGTTSCSFGNINDDSDDNQKMYTVTYDYGNNIKTVIEVQDGSKLTKPVDPFRDGYAFDGWYNEERKWLFSFNTVNSDLTLVAKWVPAIEVIFQRDNGEVYATDFYAPGDTIVFPATDPVKEGYTFTGWATIMEDDFYFSDSIYVIAEDYNIDAQPRIIFIATYLDVENPGVVVRPGQKETVVTFWMYGDQVELDVYKKIVKEFNTKYEGSIKVDLVVKQADLYDDTLFLTLNGTVGPDVFYVSESRFKGMAELGYLYDLTNVVKNSKEYDITKIWPSAVTRFQYDVKNKVNIGPESKYYAVPKDIGPTVIFYNETMFNQAGVKVLSVAAEDLAAFNSGSRADDRGNTKAALGIQCEVKEKGYFVDTNGQKWFNNQVEMNWEETVALSNVIQEYHDPTGSKNIYGYFTEWWFNYGWSVGGDCIQYIESDAAGYTGGYWDFTLMDDSANYIVADDAEPFTINGNTYQPGEIISYQDKLVNEAPAQMGVMDRGVKTIEPAVLTACQNGQLNKLPSQRAAFTEFVRLSAKKSKPVDTVNGQNLMGYGITPSPQSIGGDSGKTAAFATGKVAMLVDGRWNVTNFREQMDGKYAWDVAPLPIYKEYDSEGNITVHGVNAGHSGSVGVAIWSQTQVANAAWKFVEYIGGEYGQSEQSKAGFAIPLQKHLAADEEIFLQTNQNPRNSKIFLDAAEFEIAGDWWYLKDNEWIDPWADRLNGDVRNGKLTLSDFYNCSEYVKTYESLLRYTRKD